jgi:MFS family permease
LLFNKLYNESTLVRIFFMAFPHYSARRYVSLSVSLQPFKEKNFSSLWAGAFLSSMGFWVQTVGQSWQVLQLTNSALLLGLVTFAATLPNVVFSPFGGVVADRFDRRHLLIGTQTIYMTTATLLGILTTLHIIAVWQIFLMALINGTFNSAGQPAWQAFIGDLVRREQLKQGIALNSVQFNLSRVIGPALGGISIGLFGIAGSYYLNALSYVAVIIPLIVMRPDHKQHTNKQQSMWRSLREGLTYVKRRSTLQIILLLQFIIAFLVFPYTTLLPVFARDMFHIGAPGLGFLNAASGMGALTGAILLMLLSQGLEWGRPFLIALCVVGGLASIAFALSNSVDVSLLILMVLGSCTVMSGIVTNSTLQILTPEEMRGRILSIWIMVAFGLGPFGNLLAGWVAQSFGARLTLALGGSLCATVALLIACLQKARKSERT